MSVVTRFAPSPTGTLHVGSVRTALFNWLFARHCGGTFLLRIEDTDRARSTPEAVQAILDGLTWMQLPWDGETVFQFSRFRRHQEVAHRLLASGQAYRCYCTPEELQIMRDEAARQGLPPRYNGLWRDRDPADAPSGAPFVVRLRAPREGETVIQDQVQGRVVVSNTQIDDMVLLRADGTPTYMLSVVVDDHDMQVTHVIRGDDHLTNAFRQYQLYEACGWSAPVFAHIPLIHGADGAKLSKRHGATGVDAFRDAGILPEALGNYLCRLGWSHGDDEIFTREQAVAWFDGTSLGRGAARFDMDKLKALNSHWMGTCSHGRIWSDLEPRIRKRRGGAAVAEIHKTRILSGLDDVRTRSKTLEDMADQALFYTYDGSVPVSDPGRVVLEQQREVLRACAALLDHVQDWTGEALHHTIRAWAGEKGFKLVQVAQPLRVALTGHTVSPGIFDIMSILGPEETRARLQAVLT